MKSILVNYFWCLKELIKILTNRGNMCYFVIEDFWYQGDQRETNCLHFTWRLLQRARHCIASTRVPTRYFSSQTLPLACTPLIEGWFYYFLYCSELIVKSWSNRFQINRAFSKIISVKTNQDNTIDIELKVRFFFITFKLKLTIYFLDIVSNHENLSAMIEPPVNTSVSWSCCLFSSFDDVLLFIICSSYAIFIVYSYVSFHHALILSA